MHPVCNLNVVAHVAKLQNDQAEAKEQWMARFIRPGLEAFETQLKTIQSSFAAGSTDFCSGEEPGLADACLIPQLYNALRWGVNFDDCERILSVKKACDAHPAFQAAHPDAVNNTA